MAEENKIKQIIEVALLTNSQPLSVDDFKKCLIKILRAFDYTNAA